MAKEINAPEKLAEALKNTHGHIHDLDILILAQNTLILTVPDALTDHTAALIQTARDEGWGVHQVDFDAQRIMFRLEGDQ